MTTRRVLLSAMAAVALCSAASVAAAQSFPNRPIRLILAFPPGGATWPGGPAAGGSPSPATASRWPSASPWAASRVERSLELKEAV